MKPGEVDRDFRAQLEAGGTSGPPDVESLRAADAISGNLTVPPEGVTYTPATIAGVPGVWVEPEGAAAGRTILYLHGGGYVVTLHGANYSRDGMPRR